MNRRRTQRKKLGRLLLACPPDSFGGARSFPIRNDTKCLPLSDQSASDSAWSDSSANPFAQSGQAVISRTICRPTPPGSSGLTNFLRSPFCFQQANAFGRRGMRLYVSQPLFYELVCEVAKGLHRFHICTFSQPMLALVRPGADVRPGQNLIHDSESIITL